MKQNKALADSQIGLKVNQQDKEQKQNRKLQQLGMVNSQQIQLSIKKPQNSIQSLHKSQIRSQKYYSKIHHVLDFENPQYSLPNNQNINTSLSLQQKMPQKNISINQIQPIIKIPINHIPNNSSQKQCSFCAERFKDQNLLKVFQCQHIFCKNCLNTYFQFQIKNLKIIHCPQQTCLKQLDLKKQKYILGAQLIEKYQIIKFRNRIQKNPKLILCPSQFCEKGYIQIQNDSKNGICKQCKTQYCITCKIKSHRGKCQSFQQILLKQKFKYKRCYGCQTVVQRNLGCPHMTCKCGSQFCYYCGSMWAASHRCMRTIADGQLVTDKLNTKLRCIRHQDYQFDNSLLGFVTKIPYYLVCLIFLLVYISWCLAMFLLMVACIFVGSFFIGYIAIQCKFCRQGNSCAKIVFLLFLILLPVGFIVGWIAFFLIGIYQNFYKFCTFALPGRLFPFNILF